MCISYSNLFLLKEAHLWTKLLVYYVNILTSKSYKFLHVGYY